MSATGRGKSHLHSVETVEKMFQILQSELEKSQSKEIKTVDAITKCKPLISELHKSYSVKEILKLIQASGVHISLATLYRHLGTQRKRKASKQQDIRTPMKKNLAQNQNVIGNQKTVDFGTPGTFPDKERIPLDEL
jgi:IS30 family transposase